MREIKFRAWDKKWKRMVYDFRPICHGDLNLFDFAFLKDYDGNYEPMQFMGLKDKKGKKVYEADIVDFGTWKKDGERAVVEYNNDLACFIYQFFSKYGGEGMGIIGEYPYRPLRKKMKVIGNIYENPELLEGDDVEK